jgi:hypothetical protein
MQSLREGVGAVADLGGQLSPLPFTGYDVIALAAVVLTTMAVAGSMQRLVKRRRQQQSPSRPEPQREGLCLPDVDLRSRAIEVDRDREQQGASAGVGATQAARTVLSGPARRDDRA